MDMRAAHARSEADLEKAEAQLQVAQAKVDELRAIRDGLALALQRYDKPLADATRVTDQLSVDKERPEEAPGPRQTASGTSRRSARGKPRRKSKPGVRYTDISIAALTEKAGGPASTREVLQWATTAGHDLSYDQVRGALTWLTEKGRVRHVAPATWALPREEEAPSENDFTPAAETAGVSTTGENGHSSQSHVLTGAGMSHSQ